MGDLGFGWDKSGPHWGGVVEVLDPALQTAIAERAHLGPQHHDVDEGRGASRSPSSRTARCRSNTWPNTPRASPKSSRSTAHAAPGTRTRRVGCLHVRPILNLRLDKDVKAMRAIAEEAFAMVREYKGSHSGEHGDGIVRSEFNEPMFGARLYARVRGGEGPLRSRWPVQSGQDRARAASSTTAGCFATGPAIAASKSRPRSTGRLIRAPAAVSRARSRCATTTAPAGNPRAASCARAIA